MLIPLNATRLSAQGAVAAVDAVAAHRASS
jgi:hypothetical protein